MQIKIGLGSLLAIIFTVLKLCGTISWSWIWVLCPVWIPLVIAIVLILFVIGVTILDSIT